MESEESKNYIDVLGHKINVTSLVWTGIILSLSYVLFGRWIFGNEIPGSFFEKPAYDTKIYVNLFKDENNSKNYRVVGDLHVYRECEGSRDNPDCYSVANIGKVTFPNGGYIEFDECLVQLNEKVSCTDYNNGDAWYVELTNQPAK